MEFTGEQRQLLDTADAWLQLGDYNSANAELEKLPPELRAHPEVFKLRCRIYEQAERWEDLRTIASGCFHAYSDSTNAAEFLACMAWCDHKLGQTAEGRLLMLIYEPQFGSNAVFSYRLACLSASLGYNEEARTWLSRAFENADDHAKLKLRALDQPELEKLWGETIKLQENCDQ
jgi:hypothetical protein